MQYNPSSIEKKWQKYWVDNKTNKVEINDKPKYYVLDMFPYPSGSGLHVGHPLGYIASDIFSRYKRLKGFNVLHPMGFDAFGLPAEQYAIQTGVHPADSTAENIKKYKSQLNNIALSYDWDREVQTCDPKFYKWTQWIFIQMFEHYYNTKLDKARPITELIAQFEQDGFVSEALDLNFSAADWKAKTEKEQEDILMNFRLMYRKVTYVNWCDELGCVLANDEVVNGVSERGGFPVERKLMLQWSLRTTAYAERLLKGLETIEFSSALTKMQQNWIGKSEGAQLFFGIDGSDTKIEVFTTRPDTIFGATYMVLAPEHELVSKITTPAQSKAIEEYIDYVSKRSERERMSEVKEVTGAFTGAYAINPFSKKRIPIWIGEYVLADYGTGAIMAVPSDDDRDHKFAEKYGIEIINVVDKSANEGATRKDKVGKMINSDFLNGMKVKKAIKLMFFKIEEMGIGKKRINYRLRDAIYSRQRFWGEPFPVYYDKNGITKMLPLDQLPVELPEMTDFKSADDGKSPLAKNTEWVNLKGYGTRETDTMPGFAGSSWYFLRYMDPHNMDSIASKEALAYWENVDLYLGGKEHAVGHLLYSRTWHKFLHDIGIAPTEEPYKKLINQGMIEGYVQTIFMKKEKENGEAVFVSKNMVDKAGNIEDYNPISVHIDFISDYGLEAPFLNGKGLNGFIGWREEYQNAKFICENGIYQNGEFDGNEEPIFYSQTELGKMSKSKYNVVNPDDIVDQYGADTFRLYEMFLGPIEQNKPWNTASIGGVAKFLKRVWSMFYDEHDNLLYNEEPASKKALKSLHQTIKKVTEDIERFSFNTSISAFMNCINELKAEKCYSKEVLEPFIILLAPFAPHISEELWAFMGNKATVFHAEFPVFDPKFLVEDSFDYPICINGKKRALAAIDAGMPKEEIEKLALSLEPIKKWTEDKNIVKIIVVPKRMVNIVVKG